MFKDQFSISNQPFILKLIMAIALSLSIWACNGNGSVNSDNSLLGFDKDENSEGLAEKAGKNADQEEPRS